MSIVATTVTAAVGANDTSVIVAATTGITSPNFQTGIGITILLLDQEYMLVTGLNTTSKVVSVVRGVSGSVSVAHVNNAIVLAGLPADFPLVTEQYQTFAAFKETSTTHVQPGIVLSGSADAIDATVPGFYVVKTAGVDAMTLAAPTAAAEGNIIEIVSDTTNAHTLTATTLLANGTALKSLATFPAFRGAYLKLRACNLVWEVLSNGASAGVVVLS
jgi:hypothetical protein